MRAAHSACPGVSRLTQADPWAFDAKRVVPPLARVIGSERFEERRAQLALAPEPTAPAPHIWAVGGGKGGVGKSVVVSSLACALAGLGRRCAVIDLDLGGANLHTLFGVSRPRHTLSHFMGGDPGSLADLLVPTSVPNLSLVGGNDALPEIANPKRSRLEKLFRHVRELDVDEVLVDLGGGSSFNVLDSFLLATRGLVVVTPEITAVENAEHFIEAAFHRALRGVAQHPEVRAAIQRIREREVGRRVGSARELIQRVKELNPPAAKLLEERADSFAPWVVANQVEGSEQERVGPDLVERCRRRLGVPIGFAGGLAADPHVREAIARRRPVAQLFSNCAFSRRIDALASGLLREDASPQRDGGRIAAPVRRDRPPMGSAPPLPARAAPLPAPDLEHPGTTLRRCREHLGLSLREMFERTRIPGLADLEAERFDALPPEPYLRGFVLEYARELGVADVGALAASYLERHRRARESGRIHPPD
jgi:flagellar biosynthesis protein FlhG